jgi:hypothetical protein
VKKLVFPAIAITLLVQAMSLNAQDKHPDRLRAYLQIDKEYAMKQLSLPPVAAIFGRD